jgi:hypothetical protein
MTDPRISCPHCKTEIKLTESLAAPLLAQTRADYEQKLSEQQQQIASREQDLLQRQTEIAHAQANLEALIAERLQPERQSLIDQGKKLASSSHEFEMAQQAEHLKHLQATLKQREEKLAEAQKQQAEFLAKQRALEDEKREMQLTIQKGIDAGLESVRAKSTAEAEEKLRLQVSERDEKIAGMARQIDELRRKAEQGSQQLQGEVLELDFERELASFFPIDVIEPVAKGELGADLLQRVYTQQGQLAGTIIWEAKRTKRWSDDWLAKLRDDQRSAHADVAVLSSVALPKGVETFDLVDGIYVVHPRAAMPLATMLRQSILEIARIRVSQQGQATKVEQMYGYLTGSVFKHRIEALIESYSAIRSGFDAEKRALQQQWKKREKQLDMMLEATTSMFGEMQAIAGKDLAALPGFELSSLADGDAQLGAEDV